MSIRAVRRRQRRTDGDRGISLVVVAISLVALVMLAALAVDGGNAYANRRHMQNAADAAAMAGARELAQQRWADSPDVSAIASAVGTTAEANGADAASLSCWLVDADGTELPGGSPVDVCGTPGASWATVGTGADGVRVRTAHDQASFFARVGGIDSFSASARATATMQPLVAPGGTVPFLVCSQQSSPGGVPLSGGDTITISPAAVGQLYELQGAQIERCGAPSDAGKGLAGSRTPEIGQWMDITTGNRFDAETAATVLGLTPCPNPITSNTDLSGCALVLPIVNAARGTGSGTELYVVNFAVFKAYGNGTGNGPAECDPLGHPTPKYCGVLVSAEVQGGTGGTGDVSQGQAYVIRLVA